MMVEQFIDRLEQRGLLDKEVVDEMRRRVARVKGKQVTPEAVAKFLVDKGHLTRFQATKLVNEITGQPYPGDPDLRFGGQEPAAAPAKRPKPNDDELRLMEDVAENADLLGETRELGQRPAPRPASPVEDQVADLTAIEGESKKNKTNAPAAGPSSKPTPPPAKSPPDPPPVKPTPPAPLPRDNPSLDDAAADLEQRGSLLTDSGDRGGLFGMLGGGKPTRLAQRRLEKSSEWDSMLLLVGGASLGVLLVIGMFLYLSLTRGAAEELFAAAETAYKDESYGMAVKHYDKFLDAYPRHEKAGLARVLRETARLRQVFPNPDHGLQVAQEMLPRIEGEEDFEKARPELASILPQIARGFVNQAKLASDSARQEELLRQTEETMALVNNPVYIPSAQRKSQLTMISTIVEDMARVRRDIDRERKLNETIAVIEAAVAAADTSTAYQARQQLLSEYPGLETDDSLYQAVLKISQTERDRVRIASETLVAGTDDPAAGRAPGVILAHRVGNGVASVKGHTVFVLAEGGVFGLDGSTGDVLWRRFVGYETTTHPITLSPAAANADALVVDQRSHQLMRLDARSGRLVWLLPVGEPFTDPVVSEERIFVPTRSGTIHVVSVETGQSDRQVVLPQPLETSPEVNAERSHFYQVGDQDNLYVVSTDTWECREVFYIGHRRGTIRVPPVMALGHLFVLENAGPDFCFLHVIQTDEQGLQLKQAQPKIRLQGQVLVPPSVGRRRVLIVTDRRAVEVYDVDPNNETGIPVISAGRHNATAEAPILSYSLLDQGYMWVANNRLTKYQVQASTGKLPAEWVLDEQDVYVAPLQLVRDVLVHVRQRQGAPGFTVAATRVNEKDAAWQTEIAVPMRGTFVHDGAIQWVSARGRLFVASPADWEQGVITQAQSSAARDDRLALSLGDAVPLGDGRSVLAPASGYSQVVLHQAAGEDAGLRLLTLTVPLGDAALPPTPFAGGLLVPLRDGRVVLSDPTTGAERVRPFHPEIEAGSTTDWHAPAVLPGGREFLIADSGQRIFRVGMADRPQAHLSELGSLRVDHRLTGPLAGAGDVVYAVTRSGAVDTMIGIQPAAMKLAEQWPLDGRLSWGPHAAGDVVLAATESELACWDGAATRRWSVPLDHAPVVGSPYRDGDQVLLAAETGSVWRVDLATGATLAQVDVGEPLAGGVVPYGEQWLVAGRCGVVVLVGDPSP